MAGIDPPMPFVYWEAYNIGSGSKCPEKWLMYHWANRSRSDFFSRCPVNDGILRIDRYQLFVRKKKRFEGESTEI